MTDFSPATLALVAELLAETIPSMLAGRIAGLKVVELRSALQSLGVPSGSMRKADAVSALTDAVTNAQRDAADLAAAEAEAEAIVDVVEEALAVSDVDAAKAEWAAMKEWRKAGSDPATKPATPNLDGVQAAAATTKVRTLKSFPEADYPDGVFTCEGVCGRTLPFAAFPKPSRRGEGLRRRECRTDRNARRAAAKANGPVVDAVAVLVDDAVVEVVEIENDVESVDTDA